MREEDIKAHWQQRDEEPPQMRIAQLRINSDAFQKRARRGDLIEYVACAAVIVGFGFYVWAFPSVPMKFASVTMIVVTLFVAYQLRRHAAARALSPDSTAASLLEFHRRELVRRRNLLRDSWWLFVAPLMVGMLVFLACLAPDRPEARLPVFIFSGVVIAMGVAISLYNRWQARRLQRQIDELDSLDPAAAASR
jgi:membrane protein implicated in regulation of membrane protease activity